MSIDLDILFSVFALGIAVISLWRTHSMSQQPLYLSMIPPIFVSSEASSMLVYAKVSFINPSTLGIIVNTMAYTGSNPKIPIESPIAHYNLATRTVRINHGGFTSAHEIDAILQTPLTVPPRQSLTLDEALLIPYTSESQQLTLNARALDIKGKTLASCTVTFSRDSIDDLTVMPPPPS